MKHIVANLAFFILRVIADIDETPDYSAFLIASNEELPGNSILNDGFLQFSNEELPDDSINLFTEPFDDSLQSSANELIVNAQPDCISSNDNSLLLSRLRPRIDACLPSLTPPLNIYDSNSILNQLIAPQTLPKIPGTKKGDSERLEEMLQLPNVFLDTKPKEQDDMCPKYLVRESQIPVCSSGKLGPDVHRKSGDDFYTLYNVRLCMSRQI